MGSGSRHEPRRHKPRRSEIMADRTKDPNEGIRAIPQDQSDEGEAEVEGHRLLVGPEGRSEPAAEVEGHRLMTGVTPPGAASEDQTGEGESETEGHVMGRSLTGL
jgi:hypothetical protein